MPRRRALHRPWWRSAEAAASARASAFDHPSLSGVARHEAQRAAAACADDDSPRKGASVMPKRGAGRFQSGAGLRLRQRAPQHNSSARAGQGACGPCRLGARTSRTERAARAEARRFRSSPESGLDPAWDRQATPRSVRIPHLLSNLHPSTQQTTRLTAPSARTAVRSAASCKDAPNVSIQKSPSNPRGGKHAVC